MASKKSSKAPIRVVQKLPVKLTTEEKLARSQEMVAALVDVEGLLRKKSEQTGDINAQIKLARKRVTALQHVIGDGTEDRDVECVEVHDFARNTVVIRRGDRKPGDPDAIVEERAMTAEERQTELPGLGATSAPAAPPAKGPGAPLASVGEIAAAGEKRRRGRPPGSKNKPAAVAQTDAPKRRGRPPKNGGGVANPGFADFAGEADAAPKATKRGPGRPRKHPVSEARA